MFFDFSFEFLVLFGVSIAVSEFSAYNRRKLQKKKQETLGGKFIDVKRFELVKNRYINWLFYGLGGLIAAGSAILGIYKGLGFEIIKPFSFGLMLIYIPARIHNSTRFAIGENGFVHADIVIKWEDVFKIEWDCDVSQKLWGVRIYSITNTFPTKIYVRRKYKPEIEQQLNEYFNSYLTNREIL